MYWKSVHGFFTQRNRLGLLRFIRWDGFEGLITRFRVARPATFSHSRGDAELRQDVYLEKDPACDYQQKYPEIHSLTPFFRLFFEEIRHTAVF